MPKLQSTGREPPFGKPQYLVYLSAIIIDEAGLKKGDEVEATTAKKGEILLRKV